MTHSTRVFWLHCREWRFSRRCPDGRATLYRKIQQYQLPLR